MDAQTQNRKPGRPPKYKTREERLAAQAEGKRRRRYQTCPGQPGRPRKYQSEEERIEAKNRQRLASKDKHLETELEEIRAAFRLGWKGFTPSDAKMFLANPTAYPKEAIPRLG